MLVAGGGGGGPDLASAELYDPASGIFAATATMAGIRIGHRAALLLDGRVLVVGGDGGTVETWAPLATAEIYDAGGGS